jgi:exodeoxyribonuclease VII small subunit
MAKTPQKLSEHSFESALERLEHIVEEMEGDRLPLEALLGRYEEGTRLVKVCQERIGAAEKRIELIAKNASGAADLTEFDAIDPPGDDMQTFPVWTVPANVPFRILLSTKNTNVTVTTAVTAQAGDGTWIASNLAIRPRSRDIVTINPGQESIAFSSTKGTDPTLAVIDTASADTMYQIEMRGIRLSANRAARLNLDFANNAATLTTNQRKSNRVNVAATLETATTEGTLYAWSYAPPQGYALVVDFAQWTAAAPTALDGWLADPDGERSELTWRTKVASPNSAAGG